MSQKIIQEFDKKFAKKEEYNLESGDFIEVGTIIRDGDKKRVQKFAGVIISLSSSGKSQTMTVRKISNGVGVEKILPIYSTNIEYINVVKKSKVRRSKLYYLRDRVGKAAMKLKSKKSVFSELIAGNTDSKVEEQTN